MAIGPFFKGARTAFNLRGPMQLPLPGMAQLPTVVDAVPFRPPSVRPRTPFTPDPFDGPRRPLSISEQMEEAGILSPRPSTHVLPYEIEDPISGVKSQRTVALNHPKNESFLLDLAEEDPELAFGVLVDALKRVREPEELYTLLSQMKFLRGSFGEVSPTWVRINDTLEKTPGRASRISPDADIIIDTEIWRAAERAGVPERFLSGGMKGASGAIPTRTGASKYQEVYQSIGKIGRRSSKNVEDAKKDYEELLQLLGPDSPFLEFSPREVENLVSQATYWLGVTAKRMGVVPDSQGLKGLARFLDNDFPEDEMHAAFMSAIRTATNPDEIAAIRSLAQARFKSLTFLDDIEAEAGETAGAMIASRRRARVESEFVNPWQREIDERSLSEAERFARDFRLVSPPGPSRSPYGTAMGRGLPYAMSDLANMKKDWRNFGKSGLDIFSRGGRIYRSFETTDPDTGLIVHKLLTYNRDTKKWTEIDISNARAPRSDYGPPIDVDPLTGKFVAGQGELVEFQGFKHRIRESVPQPYYELPPRQRLAEIMQEHSAKIGLVDEQRKKVLDGVLGLFDELVSSNQIVPGTPQYNWMVNVFGRLSINISGPGAVIRTTNRGRGTTVVARDRNAGRRAAALVALKNSEEAGFVPQEASNFIKQIMPADDVYEKLLLSIRKK
jgi:hypothetical protein